jgi:hypothetical protein
LGFQSSILARAYMGLGRMLSLAADRDWQWDNDLDSLQRKCLELIDVK